MSNQYLISD